MKRHSLKGQTANMHVHMIPLNLKPTTKFATPPQRGGVLERANFHATPCFCFLHLSDALKCQHQFSRVLKDFCFAKSTPQNALSDLEGVREVSRPYVVLAKPANVGQTFWCRHRVTLGKRRANIKRRADVGQTPGRSGKVCQRRWKPKKREKHLEAHSCSDSFLRERPLKN